MAVLLVEETRVPIENDRPAASLLQTLSHIVVSSIPRVEKQNTQKNTTNIWFVNQVSDARLLGASCYMALPHFMRKPGNSW